MALRLLPLAAGALSRPRALPTTLPRSFRPPCRALRPGSSSVRSPVRTERVRTTDVGILSKGRCRASHGLRWSALRRSRRRPPGPARCMYPAGAGAVLGPPGRLVRGRAQRAHDRLLRLAVIWLSAVRTPCERASLDTRADVRERFGWPIRLVSSCPDWSATITH